MIESTTFIVLAFDWRWMFTIMAGVRSFHAARRVFSTLSRTVAMSPRSGRSVPVGDDHVFVFLTRRWTWSLASIVNACCGPLSVPLTPLTLVAEMAVRTSSRERPREERATGVRLYPDGRFLSAQDRHEADPARLGNLGGEARFREVLELVEGQRLGGQSEGEDGASAGLVLL